MKSKQGEGSILCTHPVDLNPKSENLIILESKSGTLTIFEDFKHIILRMKFKYDKNH